MNNPPHPGTITFVNSNSGEEKIENASNVPESIRFAKTDKGIFPVVRVVAHVEGDRRSIREYGSDGALLRSTVQYRNQ